MRSEIQYVYLQRSLLQRLRRKERVVVGYNYREYDGRTTVKNEVISYRTTTIVKWVGNGFQTVALEYGPWQHHTGAFKCRA